MKTTTSLQSIHSHRLSRLHKSGLVEQAVTHRDLWFGLTLQRVGLMAQSCPFLCYPMDCSLPGSSVNGVSQASILECVAIYFSRGSSWPRDQTHISCIGRWILYHWAPGKALKEQRYMKKQNLHVPIWYEYHKMKVLKRVIIKPLVNANITGFIQNLWW